MVALWSNGFLVFGELYGKPVKATVVSVTKG